MRDVFEWLIIDYCKELVFMRMMRDEYLRLSSSSPQTPPWWPEAQVVWLLNQIDGGYWVHRDLFVFYKMFVFDKKFVSHFFVNSEQIGDLRSKSSLAIIIYIIDYRAYYAGCQVHHIIYAGRRKQCKRVTLKQIPDYQEFMWHIKFEKARKVFRRWISRDRKHWDN